MRTLITKKMLTNQEPRSLEIRGSNVSIAEIMYHAEGETKTVSAGPRTFWKCSGTVPTTLPLPVTLYCVHLQYNSCVCADVPSIEVPFSVLNSWHRTSTYQRLAPAWAKIWSWTMPSAVRVGRIKDLIIAAPRLLSSKAASSPYRDVTSHVRFLFSSKERRPCTIWLRMVKQE